MIQAFFTFGRFFLSNHLKQCLGFRQDISATFSKSNGTQQQPKFIDWRNGCCYRLPHLGLATELLEDACRC